MDPNRVTALAGRTGLPVQTLLHYEQVGMLAGDGEASTEDWRDVPVACSLTAADMGDRVERWRGVLEGAAVEPLPEGLRLVVPLDRFAVVAELAEAERACCPFFDFRLRLAEPDLHLDVRAPAEGRAMVAEVFPSPST